MWQRQVLGIFPASELCRGSDLPRLRLLQQEVHIIVHLHIHIHIHIHIHRAAHGQVAL